MRTYVGGPSTWSIFTCTKHEGPSIPILGLFPTIQPLDDFSRALIFLWVMAFGLSVEQP